MTDSSPASMFSIAEYAPEEQGASLPSTSPPSSTTCSVAQSSPNLRRNRGNETRVRTESASEYSETDHLGELSYRSRSRSAPSSLLVAVRYGRELRRMSDEFDQSFTGLPRPKSAGEANQLTKEKSIKDMFMNFWGRRKNKGKIESSDEEL
ncbi:bcl2-associated agonist of cell death [Pelobates cultripes]|uniref:Bcl2-associated agonist of cell death n=1 Tax=Pelobates cultripes TaxID=61616 RepID=A0AAD1SIK5_PELCU|nr:bcl2-associated agonist of cell death [Pelobates cultripes]